MPRRKPEVRGLGMPMKERALEAIADSATPMPGPAEGKVLALRVTLDRRGHGSIEAVGADSVAVNDDEDLVRRFAQLIAMTRLTM